MSKPPLQWLTADGEHAWTGSNDDCPDCYFVTSARTLYPTLWYAHVVRVKQCERPKVKLIAEKLGTSSDAKVACERHWQGKT